MSRNASRTLGIWVWVLLALLAAHDLTHALDNGLDTKLSQLAIVSVPQWVAIAAVTWVFLRGDARRSHIAALLLGAGSAIGFVVIHLLPFAPASFWDLHPSPESWVLVWVPVGVALYVTALTLEGWRRLDADGPAQ